VFNAYDPETIWLVITNVVLGLVVLACLLVVAVGVLQEVRQRFAHRVSVSSSDAPTVIIPLVGPTMADGGEPMPELAQSYEPVRRSNRGSAPSIR
jgi:hypothetical protein